MPSVCAQSIGRAWLYVRPSVLLQPLGQFSYIQCIMPQCSVRKKDFGIPCSIHSNQHSFPNTQCLYPVTVIGIAHFVCNNSHRLVNNIVGIIFISDTIDHIRRQVTVLCPKWKDRSNKTAMLSLSQPGININTGGTGIKLCFLARV